MDKSKYDILNNFDNVLKTYDERKSHVENTCESLESMNVSLMVEAMNNNSVSDIIEKQATYLLNSLDVESGRKQEYGYYRDDTDYKSNYAIGGNTLLTDNLDDFERYMANKSIGKFETTSDLLDIKVMTPDNKKRFLKYGIGDMDLKSFSNQFQSKIKILIDNIIDSTKDDIDKEIVINLINGESELSISEKLGISRRSVNKRLNKICNM